jgi:type IV pilus assembly protein PilB
VMGKNNFLIDVHLRQLITADQAYHYRIIPTQNDEDSYFFKTDATDTENLITELVIILDCKINIITCSTEELNNYLITNYRKNSSTHKQLSYTPDFLEKILYSAKETGSSDIHFEPYEESCRVRFRLDGKLIEQFNIPLNEYPVIINKIKIKADLDITEKRLPQDGRISIKTDRDEFDIRVSSLPTLFGEKIVLRILQKDGGSIDIDVLGFSTKELNIYKEVLRKPNGIILISGPTGSGKTTTLYATLQLLNTPETNIYTIEDPIEYTIEGVNQVQVKENIGFGFSRALRTFLRQDPNIIMVGEIRDVETANMAIRTALIGRLVLSTIHTNSAWATISRLVDMGIAPFLIATTLNMSVAQRLLRKLCPHCKCKEVTLIDDFPENFEIPKDLKSHFKAVGCPKCHYTGYLGRKAIYEIIPITKELVIAIKNNAIEIENYLKEHKITTLRENALQMVTKGTTSIEEAYPILTN